jgi:hypothetical protein
LRRNRARNGSSQLSSSCSQVSVGSPDMAFLHDEHRCPENA